MNKMPNNRVKFSILIPVFNVEKYIRECLESVLNQTFIDFEIILVNDGSTDKSGQICDDFAKNDYRIKVIHQVNQGLIASRRKAISQATGDFFLFLDSDDYWDNDLLESINNIITEYNCDLVIFKYKRVTDKGVFLSQQNDIFSNLTVITADNKQEIFRELIKGSGLNNLVCKVAKRTIVDTSDYSKYEKIKNAEDLLQTIPLIKNANKILFLNKAMYNYRQSANSITQTFYASSINDITTVRSIVLENIKELNIDNEENIKNFHLFYFTTVMKYLITLSQSDVSKMDKFEMFRNVKKFKLFVESSKFARMDDLSLNLKIIYYLFDKSYYNFLIAYSSLIRYFISAIKNSIFTIGFRKICAARKYS